MNKRIIWTLILTCIAIIGFWVAGSYNKLVDLQENVETSWSQVENEYQRRSDFIPQLVATVQAAATHEKSTMTAVMEARAKATQISIDPSRVTPEQMAQFQAAQGEISQALGRLMVVSESYPTLKANDNFLRMQSQLEGCQNRCTVARSVYNEQARALNKAVRSFPTNIVASLFGFEKKPYFEAEDKSNPTVEFQN